MSIEPQAPKKGIPAWVWALAVCVVLALLMIGVGSYLLGRAVMQEVPKHIKLGGPV